MNVINDTESRREDKACKQVIIRSCNSYDRNNDLCGSVDNDIEGKNSGEQNQVKKKSW